MSACDALVFPSFQEGSPNIVKQAMACNLPIVSTDVGDVRQVVGSTKYCYVCGPTVPEFVAKLSEILVHRPRTDGRDHIRHLESPAVARKVINVYEQVLANRVSQGTAERRSFPRLMPAWCRGGASEAGQPVKADK